MRKISAMFLLMTMFCGYAASANVSLEEAIEQSAEKITGDLPKGARVAIVAFESENDNLSDYIMKEIVGSLVDRGLKVADRHNLKFVRRELKFQESGALNENQAKAVGRNLAAKMVITGEFIDIGNKEYRYRANAIHVEGDHASSARFNVNADARLQNRIAALSKQNTNVRTVDYDEDDEKPDRQRGVSEHKTPQSAGEFLDRGITFKRNNEYDKAIVEFTEALKLDPKMAAAYYNRGISYYFNKDYDKAIEDYSQAIKLNSNYSAAFTWRGIAYDNKGEYDKAIESLSQAIRLNSNDKWSYYNRAKVYVKRKSMIKRLQTTAN